MRNISTDLAAATLEGALNYKYARLYEQYSQRFYYSNSYEITLSSEEVLSNDIDALYSTIKADLKTFQIGQDGADVWPAIMDIEFDPTDVKIEVRPIFCDLVISEPLQDVIDGVIYNGYPDLDPLCASNAGNGMVSGTAPIPITFGASASANLVQFFGDIKYSLNYTTAGSFATNITSESIAGYLYPTLLWTGSAATCMNNTGIETYMDNWLTCVQTVNNTSPNTTKVYTGQSFPCTWDDYTSPLKQWYGGRMYFGNYGYPSVTVSAL